MAGHSPPGRSRYDGGCSSRQLMARSTIFPVKNHGRIFKRADNRSDDADASAYGTMSAALRSSMLDHLRLWLDAQYRGKRVVLLRGAPNVFAR